MTVVRFSFPDNPGVIATPIYRTLESTFVRTVTPLVIPLDDSGVGFAQMSAGVWEMNVDVDEYVLVPSTAEVVEYSTLTRLDLTPADILAIAGTPGPQGVQGAPGTPGVGIQGVQGEPGTPGADGPAGPTGAQGIPGSQGAQGSQGIPGPQGAASTVAGPQGVPGTPGGSGVAIGTSAGTAMEGNDPRVAGALLDAGEETFNRMFVNGAIAASTGAMRMTFFTARKTETISAVRVVTGTTAAAATPTLCRVGIYSVDGAGNLSLVASTVNDTALFNAASTVFTKSLAATWNKIAGQRYAIGVLVVTAATAPTIMINGLGNGVEMGKSPRLCGVISGLADLPAASVAGTVTDNAASPYFVVTP